MLQITLTSSADLPELRRTKGSLEGVKMILMIKIEDLRDF